MIIAREFTKSDEEQLTNFIDEIRAFIDSLELAILHRSFNSSKNDNVPVN